MKKILDVTCGSRSIWFNKNHPDALYTDLRKEYHKRYGRNCDINPDLIADFTDLPFSDNTFYLVVFDPPQMYRKDKPLKESSWMGTKYGQLDENWPEMLRDGFRECMRVLKPNGVLIFKWNEINITTTQVLNVIDYTPLFGHTTGSKSKTKWMAFMKEEKENG